MVKVKTNNNVVYRSLYHVVWCTKYRRPVLNDTICGRLIEIIKEVCDERECEIEEVEATEDHVHLLVGCDPQYGIHRLVKQVKGRSSRYLRQEFPELRSRLPTLWTNSYFVSTVGGATLEVIKKYVESQRGV